MDSLNVSMRLQDSPDKDETLYARAYEELACEDMERVLRLLAHHGANADGLPHLDQVPPELRDTPCSRRLLAALEECLDAARAVDQERRQDWSEAGTLSRRSRPAGWAGTLTSLVERLRIEVEQKHPTTPGWTLPPGIREQLSTS